MVVRAPGRLPEDVRCDALLQHMDIAPLLFELAGLDMPSETSAISALRVLRGDRPGREAVYAEHAADNILKGVDLVTMVRTRDWKLVHYRKQEWGELYDLKNDPGEVRNLWADPRHAARRADMEAAVARWRGSP
jgi:arylsulfatase A-like enzyme